VTKRLAAPVLALLILSLAFFSGGCSASQRKELMDEVKAYASDEIAKALPGLKDQAGKFAQDKIDALEAAQNANLDSQLATINDTDASGAVVHKTWKDFDADHDGHLSPSELATATTYVTTQIAKGHASKATTKGALGAIGLLLLAYLGRKGAAVLLTPKPPAAPPPTGGIPPAGNLPPGVPPPGTPSVPPAPPAPAT
jgi:hypothetical protein